MFLTRCSILALLITGWLLHPAARGDDPAGGRTVRLLTVGNSFSHNAAHYLGDLARATGDTLILREDNVGGGSLELHWGKSPGS